MIRQSQLYLVIYWVTKGKKKTTFKQALTVNQSRTQYLHFNNDGNL